MIRGATRLHPVQEVQELLRETRAERLPHGPRRTKRGRVLPLPEASFQERTLVRGEYREAGPGSCCGGHAVQEVVEIGDRKRRGCRPKNSARDLRGEQGTSDCCEAAARGGQRGFEQCDETMDEHEMTKQRQEKNLSFSRDARVACHGDSPAAPLHQESKPGSGRSVSEERCRCRRRRFHLRTQMRWSRFERAPVELLTPIVPRPRADDLPVRHDAGPGFADAVEELAMVLRSHVPATL